MLHAHAHTCTSWSRACGCWGHPRDDNDLRPWEQQKVNPSFSALWLGCIFWFNIHQEANPFFPETAGSMDCRLGGTEKLLRWGCQSEQGRRSGDSDHSIMHATEIMDGWNDWCWKKSKAWVAEVKKSSKHWEARLLENHHHLWMYWNYDRSSRKSAREQRS